MEAYFVTKRSALLSGCYWRKAAVYSHSARATIPTAATLAAQANIIGAVFLLLAKTRLLMFASSDRRITMQRRAG
jgi:hypothetical protein